MAAAPLARPLLQMLLLRSWAGEMGPQSGVRAEQVLPFRARRPRCPSGPASSGCPPSPARLRALRPERWRPQLSPHPGSHLVPARPQAKVITPQQGPQPLRPPPQQMGWSSLWPRALASGCVVPKAGLGLNTPPAHMRTLRGLPRSLRQETRALQPGVSADFPGSPLLIPGGRPGPGWVDFLPERSQRPRPARGARVAARDLGGWHGPRARRSRRRLTASPSAQRGRRLVCRSRPPALKSKEESAPELAVKGTREQLFFFT